MSVVTGQSRKKRDKTPPTCTWCGTKLNPLTKECPKDPVCTIEREWWQSHE